MSTRSSKIPFITAGNAVGNYIPPYFIYPGKRWMHDFLEGVPPGASCEMSESGWSNGAVFENYDSKSSQKSLQIEIYSRFQ